MGSNAAQLMFEAGYKIVGIAEVGGGLYNKNGIDLKALIEYRQKNGTVHGFPEAEKYDAAELLVTDCEILIPAATENVITSRNADRVKCRILAEGANGPTTSAADDMLNDKGVFVIPRSSPVPAASPLPTSSGSKTAGYFWKESVVRTARSDHHGVISTRSALRRNSPRQPTSKLTCWRSIGSHTLRQRGIYA